ncbi:hypothetical protein [Pseudoalteromonas sp. R3]|uniref:hypothetical protein n=1 Tax=Pseudoalteromonas sp. R3 TaxID=1709477 RepID=UPI000AF06B1C|nr:hypothetical protein [Pseudoalteromonas sp. R3]
MAIDLLIKTPEEASAIIQARNARIASQLVRQGKCRRQIEDIKEQRARDAEFKEVWE